jgi:proteasome lid subunit RPN8/RPN11
MTQISRTKKRLRRRNKNMVSFKNKQQATTCHNALCNRAGIQVFGGDIICKGCHGEMISFDQFRQEIEAEIEGVQYTSNGDDGHNLNEQLTTASKFFDSSKQEGKSPLNDTFTCPSDLTGCPIAKKTLVMIPLELFQKWVFLATSINTEWIAYLIGHEEEEFKIRITDMYFPRQIATPTHVDAEEGEIREGTIAAVHSHVGMDAFFSSEDIKHMNHRVELVLNRSGHIKANSRTKLECGRYHRGEAEVLLVSEEQVTMLNELKEKITRDTTQFQIPNDTGRSKVPIRIFNGFPQ